MSRRQAWAGLAVVVVALLVVVLGLISAAAAQAHDVCPTLTRVQVAHVFGDRIIIGEASGWVMLPCNAKPGRRSSARIEWEVVPVGE